MFPRASSALVLSLLLVGLQYGDDPMKIPCSELKAAIDAETDPVKKAELSGEYNDRCATDQARPGDDDSGGNGPPPPPPTGR